MICPENGSHLLVRCACLWMLVLQQCRSYEETVAYPRYAAIHDLSHTQWALLCHMPCTGILGLQWGMDSFLKLPQNYQLLVNHSLSAKKERWRFIVMCKSGSWDKQDLQYELSLEYFTLKFLVLKKPSTHLFNPCWSGTWPMQSVASAVT